MFEVLGVVLTPVEVTKYALKVSPVSLCVTTHIS